MGSALPHLSLDGTASVAGDLFSDSTGKALHIEKAPSQKAEGFFQNGPSGRAFGIKFF